MERFVYIIIFLLIIGVIAAPSTAQDRRRRARPQPPPSTKPGNVRDVDLRTTEERARLVEECELADTPKPEGEIKVVSQLCGKAVSQPQPTYPKEAKDAKVAGVVQVHVVIDEKGRVIWAQSVGPTLLLRVSRSAACRARYSPTIISGRAVRTETSITYNFVLP
jgi:TonB family protein